MASRIMHLAVANEIAKKCEVTNLNRFLLGSILPDAAVSKNNHRKITTPDGKRRTFDLSSYRDDFLELIRKDDLYLGFYLHIAQDILFRYFLYETYHWSTEIAGNVQKLYNDYALSNKYIIQQYNLENNIYLPNDLESEPVLRTAEYDLQRFFNELHRDFSSMGNGEVFFFTNKMTDEYIHLAVEKCLEEIAAVKRGQAGMNEYEFAWSK